MELLNNISKYALCFQDRVAVKNSQGEELTYKELEEFSNNLACYIKNNLDANKSPIIVYGHKNPYMLVAFLACVKAGHPYCPIDISNPEERTEAVIEIVHPEFIIATEPLNSYHPKVISLIELKKICKDTSEKNKIDTKISDEDIFYILFTSGSTGDPKGVQVTAKCLDVFLQWSSALVRRYKTGMPLIFLNQAPFSFDLSVMDVYTSLFMGGTLFLLDKVVQLDFKQLIPALKGSHISVWVSTPSFAKLCLSDRQICEELLPELGLFLFCGEVLTNKTALQLMERFPKAKILNTYGPTEATVAVTEQEITFQIAQKAEALPIGKPNPKIKIEIEKEDGTMASPGEAGEIIIIGDTVAKGYFKKPELTKRRFFQQKNNDGESSRAYRTGDTGFIDEDGCLHYLGRIDNQVKLNGYRIELGDVENNLLKLDSVQGAVVLPKWKEGQVKSLVAFISTGKNMDPPSDQRAFSKKMKMQLKQMLPEYMIPKQILWIESLPMNSNGKVDRKKMGELIE